MKVFTVRRASSIFVAVFLSQTVNAPPMVFDENGKLVFEYDGDIVTDTAGDSRSADPALLISAVVLLAAAVAVITVKRRVSVR